MADLPSIEEKLAGQINQSSRQSASDVSDLEDIWDSDYYNTDNEEEGTADDEGNSTDEDGDIKGTGPIVRRSNYPEAKWITDYETNDFNHLRKSPTNDTVPRFTLFPKLPPELRNKIIKHALPPNSTIRLRFKVFPLNPDTDNPDDKCFFGLFMHNPRSSSLLPVNKDFRGFYKDRFPSIIKVGVDETSYFYYSPSELVYLENFTVFISLPEFMPWLLQHNWVKEVTQIAIRMNQEVVMQIHLLMIWGGNDFVVREDVTRWKGILGCFEKLKRIRFVEADAAGDRMDKRYPVGEPSRAGFEVGLGVLRERMRDVRDFEMSLW
jgi:2EXR family